MNNTAIKITDGDVKRFSDLCVNMGYTMSDEQATERIYQLVRAVELTYQSITQEDMNEYLKQNEQRTSKTVR